MARSIGCNGTVDNMLLVPGCLAMVDLPCFGVIVCQIDPRFYRLGDQRDVRTEQAWNKRKRQAADFAQGRVDADKLRQTPPVEALM